MNLKLLKILGIVLLIFVLNSCKGGDARKNPPQPELRVKKTKKMVISFTSRKEILGNPLQGFFSPFFGQHRICEIAGFLSF